MLERGQVIRIGANFVQLFSGFVIGLIVIRLLLTLGEDVFGVITVLAAGTGIAQLLREVVTAGTVPKLGEAWHTGDQDRFVRTLSSTWVLSLICAGLSVLGFGVLALLLGVLNIPAELNHTARIFVGCKALQTAVTVALAPVLNMLVVRERMVQYNLILVAERSMELVGALLTLSYFSTSGEGVSLLAYGALVTAGILILQGLVFGRLIWTQPLLRPRMRMATRAEVQSVGRSFGWNAIHAVALNLHLRLDVLIMNIFFGLTAGMYFSLAGNLASYVRQLTMGLVKGLDAVSARHQGRGQAQSLVHLAQQQMALQASLVFPASLSVLFATEPLLHLWIGDRLADPDASIPTIALICRILVVGIAARSLSESWAMILAGAGQISRFSPVVMVGALANPLVIGIAALVLPEPLRYLAPAVSLCLIFCVVHLIWVPRIASRCLQVPVKELFRPCLIPLGATGAGLGVYLMMPPSQLAFLHLPADITGFLLTYGIVLVALGWKHFLGPLVRRTT